MKEEALPEQEMEEEVEEEEEEATPHPDPQEVYLPVETQPPQGLTSLLTYDPSPVLTMPNQWENSPTSSMAIEPKQRRS